MPEERSALAPAVPAPTTRAERRLPRPRTRNTTAARARLTRATARRHTFAHRLAPNSQNAPQAQHGFSPPSMGAKAALPRSSRRPMPARPPASRDAGKSSGRDAISRLGMLMPHELLHVSKFCLWRATATAGGRRAAATGGKPEAIDPASSSGSGRLTAADVGEAAMYSMPCYAMPCAVLYSVCIRNGLRPSTPDSTTLNGLSALVSQTKPNSTGHHSKGGAGATPRHQPAGPGEGGRRPTLFHSQTPPKSRGDGPYGDSAT
jgi:hypothetical protein